MSLQNKLEHNNYASQTFTLIVCLVATIATALAQTPPAISDLGIAEETTIYVPKDAIKDYKKDPNWEIYKKQIKAIK